VNNDNNHEHANNTDFFVIVLLREQSVELDR